MSLSSFGFEAKKQGKINRAWKSRFFQCDANVRSISYFAKEADANAGKTPKGMINVTVAEEVSSGSMKISDESGRIYSIKEYAADVGIKLIAMFGAKDESSKDAPSEESAESDPPQTEATATVGQTVSEVVTNVASGISTAAATVGEAVEAAASSVKEAGAAVAEKVTDGTVDAKEEEKPKDDIMSGGSNPLAQQAQEGRKKVVSYSREDGQVVGGVIETEKKEEKEEGPQTIMGKIAAGAGAVADALLADSDDEEGLTQKVLPDGTIVDLISKPREKDWEPLPGLKKVDLTARIENHSTTAQRKIEYIVHVVDSKGNKWEVAKRYSEFHAFMEKLNGMPVLDDHGYEITIPIGYPRLAIGIPFPEKSLPTLKDMAVTTSMTDEQGVMERRDDLNRWMVDLVCRPFPVDALAEIHKFFKVKAAAEDRAEGK